MHLSKYEKRFIVWSKWKAKKSLISKPSTITNLVSSILNYYQLSTTKYSTAKLIVYKKTDEWCIEWQQVTTNDNKWQRVVQRVTTNDNERQRVVQQVIKSDNE